MEALLKFWLRCGAELLVFAGFLFSGAGTLRWPAAWVLIGMLVVGMGRVGQLLRQDNPALLADRAKAPIQRGQLHWDRAFQYAFYFLVPAWLILMGIDVVRYGWAPMPLSLRFVGAAGIALSLWMIYRIFRENSFAIPVVKAIPDRTQTVIRRGPYSIVRHPLYAVDLLFLVSISLFLGSWWGLAATVGLSIPFIARTALEDRELRRNLQGYADYADQVRFRLLPYVW